MQFSDLLATFRTELAASLEPLPEWLTAFAAREEDPQSAQDSVSAYADCMERTSETAVLLGLEGLALFFNQRAAESISLATDASLERIMQEAQWPALVDAYLAEPDVEPALALAQWLMENCAQDEQTDAILGLLAQPVEAPEGLIQEAVRKSFAGESLSLQTPADVDARVYEAFAHDAPAQAASASSMLVRYLESADKQSLDEARRIVHSFKGTANIIGIYGIGRFAHAFEDLLDRLAEKPVEIAAPRSLQKICLEAADGLESLVDAHLAHAGVPGPTLGLLQRISDWDYALATAGWDAAEEAYRALPQIEISSSLEESSPDIATPAGVAAFNTAPEDETKPTVRVGVDTIDALLRASSELSVQVVQLQEQLASMMTRNAQLTAQHSDAQRRVQALQLAVDTHTMRQAAAAGTSVDPLEMDRYNELSSLARMTAESVDDARTVGQGVSTWISQTNTVLATQAQLQKQMQQLILGTRMVTAGALSARLARAVRQTARTADKNVAFEFIGDNVALDADVLDALAAPLIHILRNAVDHGIEPAHARSAVGKEGDGKIVVRFQRVGARVDVTVKDDGAGYNFEAIREKAIKRGLAAADARLTDDALAQLTLLPGFSTAAKVTEVSGRGVGMDVVAEAVRRLNGQLHITSRRGEGTEISMRVPASLALMHLLIVRTAAGRFAIPSSSVEQAIAPGLGAIEIEADKQWLRFDGKRHAAHLLGERLGAAVDTPAAQCAWLLLELERQPIAIGAEALVTTREAIVRRPGRLAGHPGLLGATLDVNGAVLPVLDLVGLLRAATGQTAIARNDWIGKDAQRTRVLVVDDSVSVRRSLTQLLEDAGYAVTAARDGLDALSQLEAQPVNIVLTDLEMPEMNGIEFTRNLRARPDGTNTPVVMITSRSTDKHRDMAKAAGVNHYLVKPYTDYALLELVGAMTAEKPAVPMDALAA